MRPDLKARLLSTMRGDVSPKLAVSPKLTVTGATGGTEKVTGVTGVTGVTRKVTGPVTPPVTGAKPLQLRQLRQLRLEAHQVPPDAAQGVTGGVTGPVTAAPRAPPPAGGRWKMLVQLWTIEKARDLVDRLIAAAGPHRMGGLDQIFEKLRTSSRTGTRKIEYLERLCEKFAGNPYYWPGERPDRAAVARMERDKAIAAIKRSGGRIARKKLLRHVHKNAIQAMLDLGEIVPIGVGEYALPGARIFRWTSSKIVEALWAVADHRMDLDELAAAVDRDKSAVRDAVARLRSNGIVVVRATTIALSPKTVQKIKNNEVIRHGNLIIMRSRLDQFDLFPTAPQTLTPSPPSDDSGAA
jgi:hypothetical protein